MFKPQLSITHDKNNNVHIIHFFAFNLIIKVRVVFHGVNGNQSLTSEFGAKFQLARANSFSDRSHHETPLTNCWEIETFVFHERTGSDCRIQRKNGHSLPVVCDKNA